MDENTETVPKNRKSQHDDKKKSLGQFFTSRSSWLTPCIEAFVDQQPYRTVVDPFAGKGDLLKCFPDREQKGFDIDPSLGLGWEHNDSLNCIRPIEAICVTNPPYLAKNIARYMGLPDSYRYFEENLKYDNLYLIALERCLAAFKYVVAIVPETFLLQKHLKERLVLASILQENPFDDTDFAVVVACWGPEGVPDPEIYIDDRCIGTMKSLDEKIPNEAVAGLEVKFNVPDGLLGLIAIDPVGEGSIRFCEGDVIDPAAIKVSSRHRTRIQVNSTSVTIDYPLLIKTCNSILAKLRMETNDLVLAPTKGNKKTGKHRRRLDFRIAKRIIHSAIINRPEIMRLKQQHVDTSGLSLKKPPISVSNKSLRCGARRCAERRGVAPRW